MSAKFTPGPWTVDRDHHFAGRDVRREVANGFNVSADDWHGLACIFTAGSDPSDLEGRANAHLIAAAPDLYEALEACLADLKAWSASYNGTAYPETQTAIGMGNTAIAKARGET